VSPSQRRLVCCLLGLWCPSPATTSSDTRLIPLSEIYAHANGLNAGTYGQPVTMLFVASRRRWANLVPTMAGNFRRSRRLARRLGATFFRGNLEVSCLRETSYEELFGFWLLDKCSAGAPCVRTIDEYTPGDSFEVFETTYNDVEPSVHEFFYNSENGGMRCFFSEPNGPSSFCETLWPVGYRPGA